MHHCLTKAMALLAAMAISVLPAAPAFADTPTATPIKHLVVIFQENVSFDHYFGTYPVAPNTAGEPAFHARPGTPAVNGLSPALLNKNPNLNPANVAGATNPFRLDRSQAVTRDQGHGYKAEQRAFDGGLMDFPPVGGKKRTAAGGNGCHQRDRSEFGLFRRKYGNCLVELRAALRHE